MTEPRPTTPSDPAGGELATTRLVVFLAALATLLLAIPVGPIAQSLFPGPAWFRIARLALAVPYCVVLAGIVWLRPRLGGVAAMTAGTTGAVVFCALAFATAWRHGAAMFVTSIVTYLTIFPIPIVGFVLAQLQLLRAGHALWKADALPRWRAATLAFTALSAFGGLLTFESGRQARALSMPPRPTPHPTSPSEMAHGSLNLTLPCLARHAIEHGEYPETLAAIGPRGSRCVPEQYSGERIPGYAVSYEPRRTTESGLRDAFSLSYEPVTPRERAYAFFQTDHTGLVYRGVDPDGRPQYPIEGQGATLGTLTGTVEYFRLTGGTGSYPRTLKETTPTHGIDCFEQYRLAPERDAPSLAGRRDGYRFQYTPGPGDATGRILTYRFDARPVVYGHPYKRSYMCDSTGTFHATDEDRPVSVTDPNPNFDAALKESLPGPCSTFDKAARQHAKYVNRQ